MSQLKNASCALDALRRSDPELAEMIAAARLEAKPRALRASPDHTTPSASQAGALQRRLPLGLPPVPRVYIAQEWPAPSRRKAGALPELDEGGVEVPVRPWAEFVNGATIVRACIAGSAHDGDTERASQFEVLQYYVDSAFWTRADAPWPHAHAPMMEASWLRMPIAHVSGAALKVFVAANLALWSLSEVATRMALLDEALDVGRRRGAKVRFQLTKHLLAATGSPARDSRAA